MYTHTKISPIPFSRFGEIFRTNKQTNKQTDRQGVKQYRTKKMFRGVTKCREHINKTKEHRYTTKATCFLMHSNVTQGVWNCCIFSEKP